MKLIATPQPNQASSFAAYSLEEACLRPESEAERFPYAKTGLTLKSTAIRGEVEGLLFTFTVRQEFINDGEKHAEDVGCYILGGGSGVLLGLDLAIGERKLTGMMVKSKIAAEKKEARDERDAAIALQWHKAQLGHIEKGETVVVEMRWARLLAFGPGGVGLCISAVPEVCHGREPRNEGVAVPEDVDARCRFSLNLHIRGEVAQGSISCPGQPAAISKVEEGVLVTLDTPSAPEQDFTLLIRDIPATSHALYMQENGQHMALASFAPKIPREGVSPLGIKILVNGSSFMSVLGWGMVQRGLAWLLTLLTPEDQISYSHVRGIKEKVRHLTRELLTCTPENLNLVAGAIAATEVSEAIHHPGADVFRSVCEEIRDSTLCGAGVSKAVLLITGLNNVLDHEEIMEIARATGHRIFVVASGWASSSLNDLAVQTGGACAIIDEKEDMGEAILRIFQKMRGSIAMRPRIDWGQKPLWQSWLPAYLYAGETLHAFALLEGTDAPTPVLSWDEAGTTRHEACQYCENTDNEALLRTGRLCQMVEADADAEKLALALKYRLESDQTTLLLAPEGRQAASRLDALSEVERIRWIHKPDDWGGALITSQFLLVRCLPAHDAWRKAFSTKKELLEYVLAHWLEYGQSVNTIDEFMEILNRSEKEEALGTFFDLLRGFSPLKYHEDEAVFLEWMFKKLLPGHQPDRYSVRLLRLVMLAMKKVDPTAAAWLREILDEWYASA